MMNIKATPCAGTPKTILEKTLRLKKIFSKFEGDFALGLPSPEKDAAFRKGRELAGEIGMLVYGVIGKNELLDRPRCCVKIVATRKENGKEGITFTIKTKSETKDIYNDAGSFAVNLPMDLVFVNYPRSPINGVTAKKSYPTKLVEVGLADLMRAIARAGKNEVPDLLS